MEKEYEKYISDEIGNFFVNNIHLVRDWYENCLKEGYEDKLLEAFNEYTENLKSRSDEIANKYNVDKELIIDKIGFWQGAFWRGSLEDIILDEGFIYSKNPRAYYFNEPE